MNQNLKQALGYFIVGVLMMLCLTDIIFPVVEFLFKICLFCIGAILILAGAGSFSEYLNKKNIIDDSEKKKEDTQ